LGLNGGPCLALSSIAEQVHDDCPLRDSLIHFEQVLAWDPAILFGLFPGCTVLADADDDVQAIVSKVEALTMTL
jgi:hypothetical protein